MHIQAMNKVKMEGALDYKLKEVKRKMEEDAKVSEMLQAGGTL